MRAGAQAVIKGFEGSPHATLTAVNRNQVIVDALEPCVIAQGCKFVAAGACQRIAKNLRLVKAVRETRTLDHAPGYSKCILQRGVRKKDRAV